MYSKQLFYLAAIIGVAAATVPSYIHVCGARNPKLEECVIKSVSSLSDKLRKGIPELDIPPSDPFYLDHIVIADMPNFKAHATDIRISGITAYKTNSLHVDLQNRQIDIDLTFDETRLDAIGTVDAKILVPIAGKGPIAMLAKNVNAKVRLNYKLIDRNGKKYLFFTSMTTQLALNEYKLDFKADNFDKTLQEAVSNALGDSHTEVLQATKPNIEKAISEWCLKTANKICKHFTYDELFPDRE